MKEMDLEEYAKLFLKTVILITIPFLSTLILFNLIRINSIIAFNISDILNVSYNLVLSVMSTGFVNDITFLLTAVETIIVPFIIDIIKNTNIYQKIKYFMLYS